MRNAQKIFVRKPNDNRPLGGADVDGRIILKYISKVIV
jgi:hypothetical protein